MNKYGMACDSFMRCAPIEPVLDFFEDRNGTTDIKVDANVDEHRFRIMNGSVLTGSDAVPSGISDGYLTRLVGYDTRWIGRHQISAIIRDLVYRKAIKP